MMSTRKFALEFKQFRQIKVVLAVAAIGAITLAMFVAAAGAMGLN